MSIAENCWSQRLIPVLWTEWGKERGREEGGERKGRGRREEGKREGRGREEGGERKRKEKLIVRHRVREM